MLYSLQEPVACAIGRHIDDRSQCVIEDCAYIVPLLDSLEAFIQVGDVMNDVTFLVIWYTALEYFSTHICMRGLSPRG